MVKPVTSVVTGFNSASSLDEFFIISNFKKNKNVKNLY